MNTTHLTKYYNCLTPWERLPLLVAAASRGDDTERDRLARSAPKLCVRIPDYCGLIEGFADLAMLYLLGQLDLAVIHERAAAMLNPEPLWHDDNNAAKRHERLWKTMKMLAYRFVVRADGWKLLCSELHIDPDVVLRDLPGYDSIRVMEEMAREIAFTPEEAIAYLQEPAKGALAVGGDCRMESAQDVARSMRKVLEEKLNRWS